MSISLYTENVQWGLSSVSVGAYRVHQIVHTI